jgi:glycosyltransferase 2 family protein
LRFTVGSREIPFERVAIITALPVAAVLAIATLLIGGEALITNLAKLDVPALGLLVLSATWQNWFRFLRWLSFTRAVGVPIGVGDGLLFYAAGSGLTVTPGRIGELLRLWFIEKRYRVPYRRSAAIYLADRIGDADAYLILLGAAMLLRDTAPPLAWSVLAGVIAINACLLFPRPAVAALGSAYGVSVRGRKLVLWARRVFRNTATLFRPRLFLSCLGLGVIGWLAAPVSLAIALDRMGVELDLATGIMIYAAAALTGGSTMLPGGGGGTEAAMVLLLLAVGVSLEPAIAATIATRLAFLWLPVACGFALLPLAMRAARRDGSPSGEDTALVMPGEVA